MMGNHSFLQLLRHHLLHLLQLLVLLQLLGLLFGLNLRFFLLESLLALHLDAGETGGGQLLGA
jgi:hypothetical protein